MSISQERKELLNWNKKHFSPFLKSFQLSEAVSGPRVGLKPDDSKPCFTNFLFQHNTNTIARPVIKESTTCVVVTHQNNVLLLWRLIQNHTP